MLVACCLLLVACCKHFGGSSAKSFNDMPFPVPQSLRRRRRRRRLVLQFLLRPLQPRPLPSPPTPGHRSAASFVRNTETEAYPRGIKGEANSKRQNTNEWAKSLRG
ncbi:hypothetical protein LX36DRAFT_662619 [Colletotrichum falcatum]|nr:hypothetical protein LX36DRAFT_662619 [Colletotrichum falcatum]